jgi:flagellar protein FliO/FliZ
MFLLRFLVRLRALACLALLAATPTLAADPVAFPAWPDQTPSIYSQPRAAAEEPTAQPIQAVAPASFEVAAPELPASAPPKQDARRLSPPRDRHLAHSAKHEPANASPVALPAFGLPLDSLYTTGTALAVVLGIFLLFAGLVRRGGKKANSLLPEEVVSVLGRVPLAARQYAELVRVGNKLVLVSVTPSGAEPLTEITDPAEIDRLVGLCRQRTKGSSTDEFEKVFRQLADEKSPSGFLGNEPACDSSRAESRLAAPSDVYAAYRGGAQRG